MLSKAVTVVRTVKVLCVGNGLSSAETGRGLALNIERDCRAGFRDVRDALALVMVGQTDFVTSDGFNVNVSIGFCGKRVCLLGLTRTDKT